MKLRFEIYQRKDVIGINVWVESPQFELLQEGYSREYLEEEQYNRIANWCAQTFNTADNPTRARRMSYADFWFTSKKDVDWFLLHWSGVDSKDV